MIYAKITVDERVALTIKSDFSAREIDEEENQYEVFEYKDSSLLIKAYRKKNDKYTILFSSNSDRAIEEAKQYSDDVKITRSEPVKKENRGKWLDSSEQIGSDEVGVGDFFGPLIVCATHIKRDDLQLLKDLKVDDSKRMNDNYILEIGKTLISKIDNYIVQISPSKLSALSSNDFNMHRIMSLTHNLAHIGLMKKYHLKDDIIIYVDDFSSEDRYRYYVGDDIVKNEIFFKCKGESFFPSVAVSSVIARYTFLNKWQEMEEILGCKIEKGASKAVDKTYQKLVKERSKEEVDKYVKKFFSNYKNNNV